MKFTFLTSLNEKMSFIFLPKIWISYSSLSTFSDPDKFDDDDDDEETKFEENQPRVYRLLVATYYVLIARSELVCYFLMILNHILTASLLSLPLPIFVFLWGMLSVPRPTKMFWITVITYTEVNLDFNTNMLNAFMYYIRSQFFYPVNLQHSIYSKTCLKWPLKNRQNKDLNDKMLLNEDQKYCRMLQEQHSAILLTCIKR